MLVARRRKFQTFAHGLCAPDGSIFATARVGEPFRSPDRTVKKSVIALIIVLALVILVSPGIVGMLANRAVEQQTEWVTDDASEVVVRAERFDRGWFSSEGSHRVSLNESVLSDDQRMVIERFGVDPLPELLIDTHIDHGLVPVSSLGREQGSLKPGLGSAVSRLALVFPDGERRELPGAIFTDIGLKGDTRSRYALEPGSAGDLSWGDSRFTLRVLPPDGSFEFDGAIERLEMAAPEGLSSLENLAVEGTAAPGGYGFMTGAVTLVIDRMTVPSPAGPPMPMGPLTVRQATEIVDERLASRFNLDFSTGAVPGVGRVAIAARASTSPSIGWTCRCRTACSPRVSPSASRRRTARRSPGRRCCLPPSSMPGSAFRRRCTTWPC